MRKKSQYEMGLERFLSDVGEMTEDEMDRAKAWYAGTLEASDLRLRDSMNDFVNEMKSTRIGRFALGISEKTER
jgi:hypothetical protein